MTAAEHASRDATSGPPVYIVDDDQELGEELADLLQSRGYAARIFPSGDSFLAEISLLDAGIVVLDYGMPGLSGLDTQSVLSERWPQHQVILFSGQAKVDMTVRAMRAGANDVLEKTVPPDTLLQAIANAATQLRRSSAQGEARAEAIERIAMLTDRERNVLDGLIKGSSNKLIARDLGISFRTVEIYRARLMRKLAANSLPDIVRVAQLAGVTRLLLVALSMVVLPLLASAPAEAGEPAASAPATVERFLQAMEAKDRDAVGQLVAGNVRIEYPFDRSGCTVDGCWRRFEGREAVLTGYVDPAFKRIGRIRWIEREMSLSKDGRRVFVEALGDMQLADGTPYRNRYVLRFDLADGQIAGLKEYLNPVTAAIATGSCTGADTRP
jgi:two-component system, LuxR family, response regulator FixJ